jgi:hypothetical protein
MGRHVTEPLVDRPRHIYGVDFSGAVHAGKKIWIARGAVDGDHLVLQNCCPGTSLPGSGAEREVCLAALRRLICANRDGVFACDFPFGIPRVLVPDASWEAFVASFPDRYRSAEEFRMSCWSAAGGRELRRVTDQETRVPFAAYHVRLYRQTYYGIRDLLHPLLQERAIAVLPMQSPAHGRATVIEICPASTLKRAGLYTSYKGRASEHREERGRILTALEATAGITLADDRIRSAIVNDPEGDALDCVVAALAAFGASRSLLLSEPAGRMQLPDASPSAEDYALEGYVYV